MKDDGIVTPEALLRYRLVSAQNVAQASSLLEGRGASRMAWARLCQAGLLEGGLSVALDLRPEELFGPLTHRMGGSAAQLKLVDVLGDWPTELVLECRGEELRWRVESLEGLVENLNELVARERNPRAWVVLGEYEDMLQLWLLTRQQAGGIAW